MKHKYVLHLDGQGHSFQFEEKLGLNSVVVSEKKLFQTYFSQFLKPNVHYLEFWEEDTKPEDVLDVLRYATNARRRDATDSKERANVRAQILHKKSAITILHMDCFR